MRARLAAELRQAQQAQVFLAAELGRETARADIAEGQLAAAQKVMAETREAMDEARKGMDEMAAEIVRLTVALQQEQHKVQRLCGDDGSWLL
jgi:chromosome segregation ATPase